MSQSSVSRRKVSSRDKSSSQDDARKSVVKTRETSRTKSLDEDSKRPVGKLTASSTTTKRSSSRPVVKQTSIDSPRTSAPRLRVPAADRPIIDQSVNVRKHSQKEATASAAKLKPKKTSSSEVKRGVSTIYMPKKGISSSKEPSGTIKRDEAKAPSAKKTSKSSSDVNKKRLPSRERRKSRTLSPSEIQVLNKPLNALDPAWRGGQSAANTSGRSESPEDYEYEDDFEDYESDFHECTDSEEASQISDESDESEDVAEAEPLELQAQKSNKPAANNSIPLRKYVDEDHMLDSGHYELQEARRRAARIDLMSARGSRAPSQPPRPTAYEEKPEIKSLPSSADEGFEDGRSGDFSKSPLVLDTLTKNREKHVHPRLIRSQQLLQMIKLDEVEWALFECTPMPYDEFIQIHGKMNTRQMSTQTNEDALSVEVQTDEIELKNMWTQFPVRCRKNLKTNQDVQQLTKELKGVGGDEESVITRPQYDILRLNEFVNAAGKLMLALLTAKSSQSVNFTLEKKNIQKMPFSEAAIRLSVADVTFLSGRPVTMIRYSDVSSRILLTIHAPADEEVEMASTEDTYVKDCCIGCQWDICEPSRPMKLFYSSSNVTACCFHPTNYNIVFGGLEDGSVSLWDLGEDESYHRKVIDRDNTAEWTLRCATFTSECTIEEYPQTSRIVALAVLSKLETETSESIGKFMPIQICSLDEEKSCVVWSLLRNFDGTFGQDLGQSWWGKLRLVKSHDIPLQLDRCLEKELIEFRDVCVDSVSCNNLYIATNTQRVLHVKHIGKNSRPSVYHGGDVAGVTCIENCPFDQSYFLAGCDDGNIRLHSSTAATPILKMKNSQAPIKIVQWSRSKPSVIFVLDDESTIHVWDLSKSDAVPVLVISPDKYVHVISMQLSPCSSDRDLSNQYLTLGMENGNVEVHKINQQFYYSHRQHIKSDLKALLDYLSIY